MKWEKDAEAAIKKVPFFVRKKVRSRVEAYTAQKGKATVALSDVNELKARFLSKGGMEKEIKGYEISTCFGGSGCPNVANTTQELAREIEKIFEQEDILGFLKSHVKTGLKFHHEFRVALSDCPNACSRPQIADIGIIGAVLPGVSDQPCTLCGACEEICREDAVSLKKGADTPVIEAEKCVECGQCIQVCPSGTLFESQKGYRILLGGRLGRHPRLAMAVPGLYSHEQVIQIVKRCIKFYKRHSKNGQRFSHILDTVDPIMNDQK